MQDAEEIRQTIRRVIEKRLAPTQIVDVETEDDVDHDGDDIVRVRIIYAANSGRPKARDVIGLTGLVRKPLLDSRIDRFPILTFMTSEEWDRDRATA